MQVFVPGTVSYTAYEKDCVLEASVSSNLHKLVLDTSMTVGGFQENFHSYGNVQYILRKTENHLDLKPGYC